MVSGDLRFWSKCRYTCIYIASMQDSKLWCQKHWIMFLKHVYSVSFLEILSEKGPFLPITTPKRTQGLGRSAGSWE